MGLFDKIKQAFTKTRETISEKITAVFSSGRKLDAELLQDLEDVLLSADVGLETTDELILRLKEANKKDEGKTAPELLLRQQIVGLLKESESKVEISSKPHVILVVGVNGTGKTTTLGKLGRFFRNQDKSILYAAGDTFRAAAIEQLKIWGERNQAQVVATEIGSDAAAVAFDAVNAAQSRNTDILLIDTAGRLHNKTNLMKELEKISRVIQKSIPQAPHEVLLVLDATTGQNGLKQAEEFSKAVGVTGLVLTKIDGTAKGGIIISVSRTLGVPIRFVGFGEGIDDLAEFNGEKFAESLLGDFAQSAMEN